MSEARTGTAPGDRVCQSVVDAVAEAEGIPPEELTPLLYEVVDPDALGRLFADTTHSPRRTVTVRFDYHGYGVTVLDDATVSIDDATGSVADVESADEPPPGDAADCR